MIQVSSISKNYNNLEVLKDVNFIVPDGCVYGIVGGNGAGKTTLLSVIAGTVKKDGGEIKIDGKDMRSLFNIPNVIGYVQDKFTIFPYLTAREYFNYLGEISNISKDVLQSRIDLVVDIFNLRAILDTKSRYYSKGTKQKLILASTLLGNPKVVLMDEPTSNFDLDAKEEMKTVIKKLKDSGKSVVIATNSFWEVENFCDVVGVMSKGEIVLEKNVADVISSENTGIVVGGSIETLQIIKEHFDLVDSSFSTIQDGKIVIVDKTKTLQQIMDEVISLQLNVYSITVYRETFKDAFLKEVRK